MTVATLDHVNIRTARMEQSRHFYGEILGMAVVPSPGSADLSVGAWVQSADGRPVIHLNKAPQGADFLGEVEDWEAMRGSAQIHHIALACTDYEETRHRLEAAGLALRLNDVPQIGLRQIFVRDPNEILIEMNFMGA